MNRKVELEELCEYFDDEIENETKAVNMLLRLKNEIQHQNEIINDNIENLLLNNLVTPSSFNKDEIVKRNNESIWLNIDDIRKWIKKFKSQE